jgi:transposase
VPDRPQRELRELTRYRTSLIRERTAEVNRLQKTLEGANIKLASVATDIMGTSGRAMLAALVAGTTDAQTLAELAKGRLREKLPDLERALTGQMAAHQRFLLAQQLAHIDFLGSTIDRVSAEIAERLRPFEETLARLDTIPGVGRRIAEVLVAEIGADMRRFPTSRHLASWAGIPWLRAALVEAAQAAGRTKQLYLGAQYRRLAIRRGTKRAVVAVGHSILVIAYHVLRRDTCYDDLGPQYFDDRDRQAVQRRLVRRLEALGFKVALQPTAA